MTSFLVKHGQIWSNMVKSGQTWSEKDGQKEHMVKKHGQWLAENSVIRFWLAGSSPTGFP
jgi:hypothetical protein